MILVMLSDVCCVAFMKMLVMLNVIYATCLCDDLLLTIINELYV